MPRLKTLWVLLPALLSLGPGATSLAGAGVPTAWAGGMVVDETGRPVAGARVELLRLISWEDGWNGVKSKADGLSAGDKTKTDQGYRALSGADGRFRIPALPADAGFMLRVVQRGFTVLVQRGIDSPVAGGQIALGTLRLPKVPTVAGRVVDSKGRPLAGAQVWALSAQDLELRQRGDVLRIRDPEAPVARTGPDGRFAIPRFEPGILEICGKGLAPARVSSLAPGRNRIVLTPPPPSSWFSGRVVDGEGLPVAKAKVYLSLSASSSISDRDSSELLVKIQDRLWNPCAPRPTLDEAVPVYDLASFEQELVALSDREGRFRFELIVDLELIGEMMVNVRAEAAGYLKQGSPQVSCSPRSPGKVELVLERGATVSGRVLTARGLPAAEADLEIGDDGSETHWTVQTDSAGRYRVLGIKPGTWDLSVQHPSGKMRRRLVVARGENRPPDLVLDGDGTREIRGRVTGPDGAGIAGASVAISFVPSLLTGSDGTSGPDGSFQLAFRSSRAAGKTLAVEVAKIGFTSSHLRLDPAAAVASPLEIRLDPGLRLTGHIVGVDAEDLPNVFVTAVQDGKDYDSRVSRDGEFRIAGLEPGEIAVTAFIGPGRLPCGSARVTLEPGTEETVLNLEIPAVTEARGMVLAPDGTPLADASVVFQSAEESPVCAQPTSATSEDDGSFSTWLQAGRYTVLGRAPGYSPTVQEAPLTVGRDPVEGLEVRLGGPGIILGGRLLGLNPEEEEIAVSVKASTGTVESTAQIAADGAAYRFDDLGPGDWSVQAEELYLGEVFRRMSRRVKLKTGQADATLDFNLAGTLSLSLRFTGAEDELSYTLVLSQPEAGWETVEETGPQSDPVYRLTRLPAGRYRLRIKDYRHDRTIELPVVLTADQEMVIDLSRPAGAGSS